ncbi:MAG: methyltransferase domain-containing protein [Yaniella sp.]|nr:methyltransferase domain-containing protein [Yaniella sp.]
MPYNESERVAKAAYDSEDAGAFYSQIWGGDDIHLGLYKTPDEPIADASHRTMEHMVGKIGQDSIDYVVDFGSGYCGAARYLQDELNSKVLAVNLSGEQNRRAEHLNRLAGVDERVTVVEASYNSVPAEDGTADLVWSQDAFLHAERRDLPMAEAARVLKIGGEFLFTDPMAADGVSASELSGVLERLNLSSLASPSEYKQLAAAAGLELIEFEDLSSMLPQHYGRVLEETQANTDELLKTASQEYLAGMMKGLQHWVDAGNRGLLSWGIFHFRKTA